LKSLGGEGAAGATGAVDGNGGFFVGQATLHGEFELTTRDVNRVGEGALFIFVGLTDVKDREVIEVRRHLLGRNFTNLSLRGVQ
jgi:hypothetical protein